MTHYLKYLNVFTLLGFVTLPLALYAEESFVDSMPKKSQLETQSTSKNVALKKILNANKGKVIYLDFWASWCTPCRKSFPWMNKIQSSFDKKAFTVISINVDQEKQLADKFLQKMPAGFPVIYDPEGITAVEYQIKGMPSSYLINQQGKIVKIHTGFFSNKTDQYENEIIELLALK